MLSRRSSFLSSVEFDFEFFLFFFLKFILGFEKYTMEP